MKVITFHSEKGGTGKTTLSTNVAAGLAQRGRSVLLIDADPQGHATISLGLKKEAGFYNALVRGDTFLEAVREAPRAMYSLPNEPATGYLYVLPGNNETHAVQTLISDTKLLKDHLSALQGLDVVIIDTPPSPGMLMALIYAATDCMVVPTEAELLSIDGLVSTISRANKDGVSLLGIIPNKYEKSTDLHQHNMALLMQVAVNKNWKVWSPIPKATAWREASQLHQSVFSVLPKSKAAGDVWKLVDRIEEAMAAWQRNA